MSPFWPLECRGGFYTVGKFLNSWYRALTVDKFLTFARPVVTVSKGTLCFGSWICFCLQVKGGKVSTELGATKKRCFQSPAGLIMATSSFANLFSEYETMGNVQKPYFVQNCLPCVFMYVVGLDQHNRTALFWTVTLRVVVIPYVLGQSVPSARVR
jgi:hypothetical protein